jgi:hypothetical protein
MPDCSVLTGQEHDADCHVLYLFLNLLIFFFTHNGASNRTRRVRTNPYTLFFPLTLTFFGRFIRFFRTVIPEPQNREPLTFAHLPYFAVGYIPFFCLAYLARRPNTYTLRLLLLPIVVLLNLTIAFRYYWTIPSLNVYNWGQCACHFYYSIIGN